MPKRSCSSDLGAERAGQRSRVALDDEVEVGAPAAEQQVADGAADQIDGLLRGRPHRAQLGVGRAASCSINSPGS